MQHYDEGLAELSAALLDRLEELAELMLGPPDICRSREWRWGRKGSLSLAMGGKKHGSWCSHEDGSGGGPIQLIQRGRSCCWSEAVRWARDWTGIKATGKPAPVSDAVLREREKKRAESEREEARNRAAKIGNARRLWNEAGNVNGTLGDRHLTDVRVIPKPTTGWPSAIRFHRPSRSLIVAATDADGAVQAVQRVHLTNEGEKAKGTPERPSKQTDGPMAGAAVRLPGDATGPLLIAEGPETGLSVWAATGHETWITLGASNTHTLSLPPGPVVVVCADDDKRFSPADKAITKAVQNWRDAGLDVRVAMPWPERRQDGSDFNGVMKQQGADAVRARIDAVLYPESQDGRRRRLPVGEARRALDAAIAKFFAAAARHDPDGEAPPPVHAVKVDVAIGKSSSARRHAADLLVEMRAHLDKRTIAIAVPTHKLGDEQAIAFEALPAAKAAGLTAAVWRGREAPDPHSPGRTMCRDLDRVRDANAIRATVQTAACKKKLPDSTTAECPFFKTCQYQLQKQRRADVWIVAHELLFAEKPAAIRDVAVVIVDEAAWRDGLEGEAGHPITLALDSFLAVDSVPGNPLATDRLMFLRRRAMDTLQGMTDGPLTREALLVAELTSANAAEARTLEWRRKIPADMHPGMSTAERKVVVKMAEANRTITRFALFWKAVAALLADGGPEASGWAELALDSDEKGSIRVLRLKGRKSVRKGWNTPTLLIDAVLDIDLVRPFWPQVELTADVAASTPHQRIQQVTDVPFSKRRLLGWSVDEDDDLTEMQKADQVTAKASARKHLRDLHADLAAIGRAYAPGAVLVVVQKAVKEALPEIGRLPPNIDLAHHNAIAGRDLWKNVAALVVVGRTMPPPTAVERIAGALTGTAITARAGWYPRVRVSREMADGKTIEAEAEHHPDPLAEAVRWQICEGELVQIIGRCRGVNRTAENPVDVFVLTDVPLPLPVHGTFTSADLHPSPAELMLAAGGIAYENTKHAADAYPAIWVDWKAARNAMRRGGVSHSRINNILIRERGTPPSRVDYQLTGAGQKPAVAWYDPALVRDPKSSIEEALGQKLAWCMTGVDTAAAADPQPEPMEREPMTVEPEFAEAEGRAEYVPGRLWRGSRPAADAATEGMG